METVKLVVEYVTLIGAVIFMVINLNRLMLVFQQKHYYFSSLLVSYYSKWNLLVLVLIPVIFFADYIIVQVLSLVIMFVIIFFQKRKKVIGLVYTNRIIRLLISNVIILTAISTLLLKAIAFPGLLSVLACDVILLPIFFIISALLVLPIEILISRYYQYRAKQKVKLINPTVIAVTGSFGKTTTKNIIYECLKHKYITYKTPKSYNTNNGISKDINDSLNKLTEMAVLEFGACRSGDIEKLCKFINPDIAVITAVGLQHLETFKSLSNIYREKTVVLDYAKVAYVNYEIVQNYNIKSNAKIVTFGKSDAADWYVTNVKQKLGKLEFIITNHQIKIKAKTSLLGEHQISNILVSAAVAYELGIGITEIELAISQLEQIEHRLERKVQGDFVVLDDSYNSNIVGFLNALDVLEKEKSPRVLITPGIVEAAEAIDNINKTLADRISGFVEEVIIINCESGRSLKGALESLNYKNVVAVNSYQEAMDYVLRSYSNGSILIENDVPDIYLM